LNTATLFLGGVADLFISLTIWIITD